MQTQQLRVRAEQGDAEAEAKLGTAYVRGRGVPQDYDAALRWYRKSAAHGSADGDVGIGAAYYYGYGVTPDYTESLSWYRKAADQGNAAGEAGVGYLYEHGEGVARDYSEALRWSRKAADQGNGRAETDLGNMYYHGKGVSQNYSEAVRWYRKAAYQGDPRAEYDLGLVYFYGRGVPRSRAEANRWFAKAADDGDERARRALSCPLTPFVKFLLALQLAGGIFLVSFAPIKSSYLPYPEMAWNRDRRTTVVAGLLCVLFVGLKWYGYTHLLLRPLTAPLNAFTWFRWAIDLALVAVFVSLVQTSRREAAHDSSTETDAIA